MHGDREEIDGRKMTDRLFSCRNGAKCGGCVLSGEPAGYRAFTGRKAAHLNGMLSAFCEPDPFCYMDDPAGYRSKVHIVFGMDGRKRVSGMYARNSHRVIPAAECVISDGAAWHAASVIRKLVDGFGLQYYDEDRGTGLIRHLLVRSSATTGQVMAVLVTAGPVFPGRRNFVHEVRKQLPQLTTFVQNINSGRTTLILGERQNVLFGPGYIEDRLLGKTFRISPGSFYQVNHDVAGKIYLRALELAKLGPDDVLLDAYCGTGTIGICAADSCFGVIGTELNPDAVRDAAANAKINNVSNIIFVRGDAGELLSGGGLSFRGRRPDVILLDPPRSGSTPEFLRSAAQASPRAIIYVSCCPETLIRDMSYLEKLGYRAERAGGFDMFGFTEHVETVCLLSNRKPDARVKIDVDLEDYYRIKDEQKKNKASE